MHTNIKSAMAFAGTALLLVGSLSSGASVFASSVIGTGTVIGSGALSAPITWNGNFPWSATGTISGIVVKAQVLPIASMSISKDTLDLGILSPSVASSTGLTIEVGTNSVNGLTITARSQSGGLTSTTSAGTQINNLTADWLAESYTFASSLGTADSTVTWFAQTWALSATQVNNNTTENLIYSCNKPQPSSGQDDVNFTVSATANAQTPAWNYQDKVTFTVVANF